MTQRRLLSIDSIRADLGIEEGTEPIGIILGTGWGDSLEIEDERSLSLNDICIFKDLRSLEGHERRLCFGFIAGQSVLALRGRIHLYEGLPSDPGIYKMVRHQTELMLQLGVKTLIATCAAGALDNRIDVGQIGVIDGFVTAYSPPLPFFSEFPDCEAALDHELQRLALEVCSSRMQAVPAGYVMVRGPFFEGRKYDKALFARSGASLVGMSMLVESCVCALNDAKMLGLALCTNGFTLEHSHQENILMAKGVKDDLGWILDRMVRAIASKEKVAMI